MASHVIKRGNNKLTLSINNKILKRYHKFCEMKGLVISKQVENFMKSQLNHK